MVTTTTPTTPQSSLQTAIPGLSNLTTAATGNIQNLLSGLPSASWARTANAYNGISSGQPATGGVGSFQENRGQDLYHQQAQQNQQTGLNDLLSLIGGYSGTVAPSAGQNLQNNQFYANLGQQGNEFNATNSLQYLNTILSQLGGSGGGNPLTVGVSS